MRVTREQFQQNRERILEAAGRLFRERGFEAVGVADVMKAAGLTHGGFYGHFKSKDDLIAQAAGDVAGPVLDRWRQVAETQGPEALATLAGFYLNEAHRKAPENGCLAAALGPEIARQPASARGAVTASVERVLDLLQTVAPGRSQAARRKRAIAAYASWIGAMVLARMSDDEGLSNEILQAVREVSTAP
jgi:TetR/AcrR family transcriptional repressor of nem operon